MKLINLLEGIRKNTELDYTNLDSYILSQEFSRINTDSRTLKQGEIFLALQGENYDGHQFIPQAIEKGALAVITTYSYLTPFNLKIHQIKVSNTLQAYQQIAYWWRQQFRIPIIGVTGSVGKTTTKELIAGILSNYGKVLKTEGNFNNEIGVPKTLLEITKDHDFAVIEMAMRGQGEIALLTQITNPTIGVITNVGTAHIGRLGSELAIAEAKCELLANMANSGVAILNADNDLLITTASKIWRQKTVTYGLKNGDLRGEIINENQLKIANKIYSLPLKGEHNALNYLGAIAVAQSLGLNLDTIPHDLKIILPKGRSKIYQLENDIQILDETYNAGWESMLASLKLLQQTDGKRKIALLGTMKELGEFADKLHYQVGETVRELNLDYLFILADEPTTYKIVEGAKGIKSEIFTHHQDLITRLTEFINDGDRLLCKASNSVGLNQVVEAIYQNFTNK